MRAIFDGPGCPAPLLIPENQKGFFTCVPVRRSPGRVGVNVLDCLMSFETKRKLVYVFVTHTVPRGSPRRRLTRSWAFVTSFLKWSRTPVQVLYAPASLSSTSLVAVKRMTASTAPPLHPLRTNFLKHASLALPPFVHALCTCPGFASQ